MKQYEVRTKDLKTVLAKPFGRCNDVEAMNAYRHLKRSLPESFLVLHEFESPAEADAARIDWIESDPQFAVGEIHTSGHKGKVRELIDKLRQAPQPTVRVIATPDGPVDPT